MFLSKPFGNNLKMYIVPSGQDVTNGCKYWLFYPLATLCALNLLMACGKIFTPLARKHSLMFASGCSDDGNAVFIDS